MVYPGGCSKGGTGRVVGTRYTPEVNNDCSVTILHLLTKRGERRPREASSKPREKEGRLCAEVSSLLQERERGSLGRFFLDFLTIMTALVDSCTLATLDTLDTLNASGLKDTLWAA